MIKTLRAFKPGSILVNATWKGKATSPGLVAVSLVLLDRRHMLACTRLADVLPLPCHPPFHHRHHLQMERRQRRTGSGRRIEGVGIAVIAEGRMASRRIYVEGVCSKSLCVPILSSDERLVSDVARLHKAGHHRHISPRDHLTMTTPCTQRHPPRSPHRPPVNQAAMAVELHTLTMEDTSPTRTAHTSSVMVAAAAGTAVRTCHRCNRRARHVSTPRKS